MTDKLRNTRLKPLYTVRDVIEIYIPMAVFAIMFITFILQIFFRYVLRQPLQWAYEVTVSCYLWMVMLGACYAQRDRAHVTFTMVCDKVQVKTRAVMMFLGNSLMLVAFTYSFLPSYELVRFMSRQKTAVFRIGLDFVYMPYIPFLMIIIIYLIRDMITQFRVFTNIASEDEIMAFDKATKVEFEVSYAPNQLLEMIDHQEDQP